MDKFIIHPELEEYLKSLGLFEEVLKLIQLSREKSEKWRKYAEIKELNLAFNWDLSERDFDFWENCHNNYGNYIMKKRIENFKLNNDVSELFDLLDTTLKNFLIKENCVVPYITNCVNFIVKYNDYLETPTTVEDHLRNVRDILNAFLFKDLPEDIKYWEMINDKYIEYRTKLNASTRG